jgi:hypothetical protein
MNVTFTNLERINYRQDKLNVTIDFSPFEENSPSTSYLMKITKQKGAHKTVTQITTAVKGAAVAATAGSVALQMVLSGALSQVWGMFHGM